MTHGAGKLKLVVIITHKCNGGLIPSRDSVPRFDANGVPDVDGVESRCRT